MHFSTGSCALLTSLGRGSTVSSKPSARFSKLRSVSNAADSAPLPNGPPASHTTTTSARARTAQLREEKPHASSALLEYSRDSPSVDDIAYERPQKRRKLVPEVVITSHSRVR